MDTVSKLVLVLVALIAVVWTISVLKSLSEQ